MWNKILDSIKNWSIMYCGLLLLALILSPSAGALTIDAKEARIRTVGRVSGRDMWNLWSNGELADFVEVKKPGHYLIEVEAKGSPAAGVWPFMRISLDGESVGDVEVKSPELKVFRFPLHVAPGHYRIAVRFTNDFLTEDEDRNLYLRRITVRPADGGDGDSILASGDAVIWQTAWTKKQKRIEDEILSEASASIENLRKENGRVIVRDASGGVIRGAIVRVELLCHEFLFGCNIYAFDRFWWKAKNEKYKNCFAELFNYATIGFYWRNYEPKRGKPNYKYTDKVVEWCERQGIRMKGHPLLWALEHGIPQWSDGQPSPEIQRQRVSEIISRYHDKIEFWEVVNEPAHLPGISIDEPYRWAREVDRNAYLIVNDHNVMDDGCPQFYALLEQAVANNIPFDGIGIQSHDPATMRFPLISVQQTLDHYAKLGKELHITEFTPASDGQPITGSHVQGGWNEESQADYAVKFYTVCFAHPAVVAITWWDLCDGHAWRTGGGLLRKNMTPKPAYSALKKLIRDKWTTKKNGETDETGTFKFRGFRGKYSFNVEWKEKHIRQDFDLTKEGSNCIEVTLE